MKKFMARTVAVAMIGSAVLAATVLTGWMLAGLVVGGAGMYAFDVERW